MFSVPADTDRVRGQYNLGVTEAVLQTIGPPSKRKCHNNVCIFELSRRGQENSVLKCREKLQKELRDSQWFFSRFDLSTSALHCYERVQSVRNRTFPTRLAGKVTAPVPRWIFSQRSYTFILTNHPYVW